MKFGIPLNHLGRKLGVRRRLPEQKFLTILIIAHHANDVCIHGNKIAKIMLTNDFISGGKIEIFSSLQSMQKIFSKLPAYFQAHPIF